MDNHDAKPKILSHHHTNFNPITTQQEQQQNPQPSMSQSQILPPPPSPRKTLIPTCVHFNLHPSPSHTTRPNSYTTMSDSTLWTLPSSSLSSSSSSSSSTTTSETPNRWALLLRSAAYSNRQRHRVRFEQEGWAFVGGRYSDDLETWDGGWEGVDEEFDGVLLAREGVGC